MEGKKHMLLLNTTHFKRLRIAWLFRPQEQWTYTIQKSFVWQAQLKIPQTCVNNTLFFPIINPLPLSPTLQNSVRTPKNPHQPPSPLLCLFFCLPKNKETGPWSYQVYLAIFIKGSNSVTLFLVCSSVITEGIWNELRLHLSPWGKPTQNHSQDDSSCWHLGLNDNNPFNHQSF